MEPFSIAATTIGLADITARLVVRVAQFVRDSKNVDEVLRSFYSEVSTLDINLRLVGRTILSHPELSLVAENEDFLSAIQNTVGNIERTIKALQGFLDETPAKESSNMLRKFLKQRKLDKSLPDIARLRLEMVSYNSSLQTVLQAIDISINMNIKTQNDPNRFADEFFRATKSLEDKLMELRSDILKLVETSHGQELEAPVQSDPVLPSMQLAQSFAERVYSKASTVSTAQSELNPQPQPENRAPYGNASSASVLGMDSGHEISFKSSGRVDLELLQAQATLKQARKEYKSGNLTEAISLCSEALEDLSEVQSSPVYDLVEHTVLFQALLHTCLGTPDALIESQRLLDMVDNKKLQNAATDDFVLDRMLLLCWTKFKLYQFEEAKTLCRVLIRDARTWNGDENNYHFNDGNTLLAVLQYCQGRTSKGRRLARVIPSDYLRAKCKEAIGHNHFAGTLDYMKRLFENLSKPGAESAAFYYIHHEFDESYAALFLQIAAERDSVAVISMVIPGRSTALTTRVCCCHGLDSCRQVYFRLESPWGIAVARKNLKAIEFMVELPDGLRSLGSMDLPIRDVIEHDELKIFQLLLDILSKRGNNWNGLELLNWPLAFAIRCRAKYTIEYLLNRNSELDLNEVDPVSSLTLMGLACRHATPAVVSLLIERGVDVDDFVGLGKRPLHVAVECVSSSVVELLIEKGANVDGLSSPDSIWEDRIVAQWEKRTTLTPLQVYVSGYDYFFDEMNIKVLYLLLLGGADPMLDFEFKRSCVHFAVKRRYAILLSQFLRSKRPLRLNTRFHGKTVLQLVLDGDERRAHHWNCDVFDSVKILIEAGADPMALHSDGQTCFHRVVRLGDANLLEILLESTEAIDINRKDNNGKTAAQFACEIIDMEIRRKIIWLLESAGAVIPKIEELNSNVISASTVSPAVVSSSNFKPNAIQAPISYSGLTWANKSNSNVISSSNSKPNAIQAPIFTSGLTWATKSNSNVISSSKPGIFKRLRRQEKGKS